MAKYKVTFLPFHKTIEVDDAEFPYGDHGQPGSILDIALKNGIDLEHSCGGNCACTTCHIIVKSGSENLSPSQPEEEDLLDKAVGVTMRSRLGCQAVVKGDVTVEIPKYSRNEPPRDIRGNISRSESHS